MADIDIIEKEDEEESEEENVEESEESETEEERKTRLARQSDINHKYHVYIESSSGEPERIMSVDTLDEAWKVAMDDIEGGLKYYVEESENDKLPKCVRRPPCVVKYQKEYVKHPVYVIYDKPPENKEYTKNDIIWIGNFTESCYYATTRLM